METPTGKPQATMDKEDSILSSLTTIAYATPVTPVATARKTRTSRFWFTLTSTEDFVKTRKAKLTNHAKEHIDAEVEERLVGFREELAPELAAKIAQVREFFLTEVAPLTMASSGGAIQSREVVQRLLGTPVDEAIFSRFENMVNRAATLKMAAFVAKYFGLAKEDIAALIGNAPQQDNEYKNIMAALRQLVTKQDLERLSQPKENVKNVKH